jgi:sporulation protein YlmC with PRC-barrel domain
MNANFRKTLIAGAIAALISSPAWAATDSPGNSPGEGAAPSGTEQPRDTSPQMNPSRDGTRDSSGATRPETGQPANDPSRMGGSPSGDASRAGAADHPLYNRTPDDLSGMEVVGSDGEDIGKIKAVVSGPDHTEVQAVISSGGFLGLGAREILVSLDELQPIDSDKVQARFTQDQVESLPQYESEEYTELESDRPISEFSAFEPTRDRTDPAMKGGDADPSMKGRDSDPSRNDRAPAQRGQPQ